MTERIEITRTVPLLDIEIDRGGDGRTVTAYAATFGNSYEVRDGHGHYDEVVNRAAFNRAIARGAAKTAQVHFNHGLTLWGTPSDRYTMPLGTPLEITADARGLLTVTRYAKTELGDEVLELIRSGAIRGQSFRGAVYQSSTNQHGPNGRPIIERMQLGLKEYGPTPAPTNAEAEMVAVRSQLLAQVGEMTPEERRELAALIAADGGIQTLSNPESSPEGGPVVATPAPPPADPQVPDHELELLELANAQRRRRTP